jgi:predicted PurR-regulated permease PerM
MASYGHANGHGTRRRCSATSLQTDGASTFGTIQPVTDLIGAAQRHRLGLFTLGTLVVLGWVFWSARGALPAFAIGTALAFVLDPPVTWMRRLGLPRWGGVLVMYAVVVGLVWALVAFAVPPLAGQTRDFIDNLPRLGQAIADVEHGIEAWYASLPLPADLRGFLDQAIAQGQQQAADVLRAILGPTLGTVVRTLTFLFGLIVVPVWLFFVLKDREGLPDAVAAAVPPAWRADARNVLALLARVGGRWVRGELALGAAVFVATATGFGILTLAGFGEFGKFTLVLALFAGVLEWFPVIGPIVAAVPALLVGLAISPGAAIAAIAVSTAVQQLENNLLVPKVMGDAVELNPAVMILSLVAGAALFGIGGAILSAPVVAASRDLYRYVFARLSEVPADDAYGLMLRHQAPVPEIPAPEAEVEREQPEEEAPPAGA